MKQIFVSAFSSDSFLPDIHICKKFYYIFFQPEILTGELNKYFKKNFMEVKMAFREVNLIANPKYVSPEEREVGNGDIVLFSNDTNYLFTVIIKRANTVFNTPSKTLVYDVPSGGVVKTPPVLSAPQLPLDYEVYIYQGDDIIPSDAPPKIIRVP